MGKFFSIPEGVNPLYAGVTSWSISKWQDFDRAQSNGGLSRGMHWKNGKIRYWYFDKLSIN